MQRILGWAADYLLYAVALGSVVTWFRLNRAGRTLLTAQAVIGVILVFALVKAAGSLHADPRPFVVNPRLHPLIAHSADNGFSSDHTTLATMIGGVVAGHRRAIGMALLGLAAGLGLGRVAAHVHHLQDVAAGLLLGLIAAGIALPVGRLLIDQLPTDRLRPSVRDPR